MIKRSTPNRLPDEPPTPASIPLVLIILIMVFMLIGWGIWWYFDYKIRMLEHQSLP